MLPTVALLQLGELGLDLLGALERLVRPLEQRLSARQQIAQLRHVRWYELTAFRHDNVQTPALRRI